MTTNLLKHRILRENVKIFPSFAQRYNGRYYVTLLKYEYDQEIPQSQTADKPMALQGRATQQSQDPRKTN